MAMFHMANDSGLFRTAAQLSGLGFMRDGADWLAPEGIRPRQGALDVAGADRRSLPLDGHVGGRDPERYVPLYEAKMIHQFDHRWATYDGGRHAAMPRRRRRPTRASSRRRAIGFPSARSRDRLAAKGWTRGWLMGWRDIARSTDERTVISGLIPRAGCRRYSFYFMFQTESAGNVLLYMLPELSQLDYIARQKLGGTSFKYFTMKQIPVLPPSAYIGRRPRLHRPARPRAHIHEPHHGALRARPRL